MRFLKKCCVDRISNPRTSAERLMKMATTKRREEEGINKFKVVIRIRLFPNLHG